MLSDDEIATTARRAPYRSRRAGSCCTPAHTARGHLPREEDRRHVAQLLQGQGRLRRQRVIARQRDNHRLLIDNPQIKGFTALARQTDEGDIQLGLAQGGHQIGHIVFHLVQGHPGVVELKTVQQREDLRMESIRTGNA
jgi:hypothetical protein